MVRKRSLINHTDFFTADLLAAIVTYIAAVAIRHSGFGIFHLRIYQILFIVMIILEVFLTAFFQMYTDILKRNGLLELASCLRLSVSVFGGMLLYMFLIQNTLDYSRLAMVYFLILYTAALLIERNLLKHIHRTRISRGAEGSCMMLVGREASLKQWIRDYQEGEYEGYILKACVCTDGVMNDSLPSGCEAVELQNIKSYVLNHILDDVTIDDSMAESRGFTDDLLAMGLRIHLVLGKDLLMPNSSIETMGSAVVLSASCSRITLSQKIVKRFGDIIAGLLGSLITVILAIPVGAAIFITDPGPVFYRQDRVGRNGRHFRIWKFRTMYVDSESMKKDLMDSNKIKGQMFKMEYDPRIIGSGEDGRRRGLGYFLRKYSIDEFPQFFNILAGQMSLVGTRPPLPDEVRDYSPEQYGRLSMKPGLTGLWQVSGRSDIKDFDRVVELDKQYISNFSISNDIRIIMKTFGVVMGGKGSF